MMFERCHTKNRTRSIKQHIKYFNFRYKHQLDHPVLSSFSRAKKITKAKEARSRLDFTLVDRDQTFSSAKADWELIMHL